jgi:signal transduction histidine kinase/CheY-like chemotaxis protein
MIKDIQFIQDDFNLETVTFLTGIVLISLQVSVIIFALLSLDTMNVQTRLPWLLIAAISASAYLLIRAKHNRTAAWLFVVGLIAFIGLDMHINLLASKAYYFLPMPVIFAGMIIEDKKLPYITTVTIITATILTYFNSGIGAVWTHIFPSAFVAASSSIMFVLYAQSKLSLVQWAIDSQQKNVQRADVFYEQREQLKDAMLEVQKANGKLEKMNEELAAARKQAEDASQAKSSFLSNMSHELRTPLNIVIGYSSSMLNMPAMYQNKPLADVYRKDLNAILSNGQYLLGLINDILDLSKIEAGKLHIHPEAVELQTTIRGIVATSVGLAQQKPIQIRPDIADDLPEVWGDETRIRQVLLNLMSNAIKFTDSGSVTLSAKVVDNEIRLAVTDTGVGIPEEALLRIFDRFEQAQYDTDRHYGGTGLGLDISQRLCEMHGSKLQVESAVGQGSTFWFTLPLASTVMQNGTGEIVDDETLAHIFDTQEMMLDSAIILLIENDAPTRKLLRRVLEPQNYVVMEAVNGQHGLETIEGILPELIILDLNLPDISGVEVLETMRNNPSLAHIPVIILSFMEETEQTSSLANVHFKKPVRPETLLTQIKQLLQPATVEENIA